MKTETRPSDLTRLALLLACRDPEVASDAWIALCDFCDRRRAIEKKSATLVSEKVMNRVERSLPSANANCAAVGV